MHILEIVSMLLPSRKQSSCFFLAIEFAWVSRQFRLPFFCQRSRSGAASPLHMTKRRASETRGVVYSLRVEGRE